MFCPNCGKSADAGVRFCPVCGTQIGAQASSANYAQPAPTLGQLVRPRYPRMIAGVCAAFALQYGWDLSLVRILTVVFALVTSGFGGLCYLAAWIIIPEGIYALPPNASQAAYPAAAAPINSSRDNPAV
jgi:phage shock protein C